MVGDANDCRHANSIAAAVAGALALTSGDGAASFCARIVAHRVAGYFAAVRSSIVVACHDQGMVAYAGESSSLLGVVDLKRSGTPSARRSPRYLSSIMGGTVYGRRAGGQRQRDAGISHIGWPMVAGTGSGVVAQPSTQPFCTTFEQRRSQIYPTHRARHVALVRNVYWSTQQLVAAR